MHSSRRWQAGIVVLAIAVAGLAAPPARAGTPAVTYFLGDVSCDSQIDSIDAALLLQREAALLEELSCADNADTDGDNLSNSVDAGLVLQYTAGLILSRVQFSLNITRPSGFCDDAEKPSVCNVPAGTEFSLSIALNHPPPEGYVAFDSRLSVGDLLYNPTTHADEEVVWPDNALALRHVSTEYVETVLSFGGLTGSGRPPRISSYRGDLVQISVSCSAQPGTFTADLVALDPARTPLGAGVALPFDVGPYAAMATTLTVATGTLHPDYDEDGTGDEVFEVGVAARLRVNCIE